MRQAQNVKRARSRGRKVVNQLTRTLDSNGPDVKIRGTASHIYEKYQALARDANSSGDRIMAENYMQHAEHYFRLINALQSGPSKEAQPGVNGARGHEAGEAVAEDPGQAEQPSSPPPASNGNGTSAPRGRRRRVTASANGNSQAPEATDNGSPELPLGEREAAEGEEARV